MRLHEYRSNPDKNPKKYFADEVLKYKGQSDIFVSFSPDVGEMSSPIGRNVSGSKLGIKPTYSWNTPIGIYGYPIDFVIKHYEKTGTIGGNYFTGKGRWEYLFVFRNVSKHSLTKKSAISEYDSIMDKLRKLVEPEDQEDVNVVDTLLAKISMYGDSKLFAVMTVIKHLADYLGTKSTTSLQLSAIIKALGFDAVIDNGSGAISHDIPTQAVFLSKAAIEIIEVIPRIATYEKAFADAPKQAHHYDISKFPKNVATKLAARIPILRPK